MCGQWYGPGRFQCNSAPERLSFLAHAVTHSLKRMRRQPRGVTHTPRPLYMAASRQLCHRKRFSGARWGARWPRAPSGPAISVPIPASPRTRDFFTASKIRSHRYQFVALGSRCPPWRRLCEPSRRPETLCAPDKEAQVHYIVDCLAYAVGPPHILRAKMEKIYHSLKSHREGKAYAK